MVQEHMENHEVRLSRRRLLKALAASGGALAVSSLLPGKWDAPVVEGGVLPAHAQTSPVLGTGDLQVTLTWDEGNQAPIEEAAGGGGDVDVDLFLEEPDGTMVWYGDKSGVTSTLDVDNTWGYGPENVFVPAGNSATGVYKVYVGYFDGAVPTTATIKVTVYADTANEATATFTRSLQTADGDETLYRVAEVAFPAGSITEKTGSITSPVAISSATK